MDRWLEVSVPAGGDPEGMCEKLEGLGLSGFVIEDEADFHRFLEENTQYWDYVDAALEKDFSGASRVKFWLADDGTAAAVLAQLEAMGLTPAVKAVRNADWENKWRDYYKPIEIGEKLVIVPEWESVSSRRLPVVLDPGLLFGTGSHATTRMCLEALEGFAGKGKKLLDLGCGSGILGIAGAVLGCESIVAVDVDEKARDIVPANAALNSCAERFTVRVGDICADEHLRRTLSGGYDIVMANIVADVIIALAPHVRPFMAAEGVFITSGIIDGREEETERALRDAGFTVEEHKHQEEWHCFVCR